MRTWLTLGLVGCLCDTPHPSTGTTADTATSGPETTPRTPPTLGGCHPTPDLSGFVVNVLDLGADNDVTTDDTAAFQAALDQVAASPTGGVVLVPAGNYRIERTLELDTDAPVHLLGLGASSVPRGSVLFWYGTSTGPMLRLVGMHDSVVEGLGFTVWYDNVLDYAIGVETAYQRESARLTFRELTVNSQSTQLQDGIRLDAGDDVAGGAGPDAGNVDHCFDRVRVGNFTGRGIWIRHPSSTGHLFTEMAVGGSGFLNGVLAPAGLSTQPAGPHRQGGGGFRWFGGQMTGVEANFELASPLEPVDIEALNSEQSATALRTVGAALPNPAVIRHTGSRFAGRPLDGSAPVVQYHLDGELVFDGNLVSLLEEPVFEMTPASSADLTLANNTYQRLSDLPDCTLNRDVVDDPANRVTVHQWGNQYSIIHPTCSNYISDHAPPIGVPSIPAFPGAGPQHTFSALPAYRPALLDLSPRLDVTAFGATPNDDSDDDALAIQAALDAAALQVGALVYLPAGAYHLQNTLHVDTDNFIRIMGTPQTQLVWRGDDESPLLLLDAIRESVFSSFEIVAEEPLHTAVESRTQPPPILRIPTANAFYGIKVDGRGGNLDFGFRVTPAEYLDVTGLSFFQDTNNEEHLFAQIEVRGYAEAAFSIEHGQSKTHLLLDCHVDGEGIGRFGVTLREGLSRGSFKWVGGTSRNHAVADIGLGSATDFVLVEDGVFTGSPAFVDATFSGNSVYPITLRNNDWTGSSASQPVVDLGLNTGATLIEGNAFHLPQAPSGPVIRQHYVAGRRSSLSVVGNDFVWADSLTSATVEVLAGAELDLRGNQYRDAANTAVFVP